MVVEVAKADFIFGEPTNLGPLVNSSADDSVPSLSADGLILVFASERPGGHGEADLWMTTRATTSEPWGEPENLGSPVNTPDTDWCLSLSPDGCTLYYASQRSGGVGGSDIWVSMRATTDDAWGEPVNLGPAINHSGHDGTPFISEDGLELYFSSLFRSGGYGGDDIWVSTRETKEDEWGTPMNLGPVINSEDEELFPVLSADGLSLFFSSGLIGPGRPGGSGRSDIWVTRRKTRDDDWGEPVNLGAPVNSSEAEWSPTFSADGSTLYFSVGRFGKGDLYEVSLEPVVDLNSDGIVDAADMSIIVDHWGTDDSLCDIGPTPFGDGIVDVQDLIVLAEHLFEEIPPVE
jgi:Tol biopolymer transport system component